MAALGKGDWPKLVDDLLASAAILLNSRKPSLILYRF
jgi:hypothetical protein